MVEIVGRSCDENVTLDSDKLANDAVRPVAECERQFVDASP